MNAQRRLWNVLAIASGVLVFAGSMATARAQSGDGSIVAWGFNEYGQCDVPAPNTDFVAVAAGGWHSLGLNADGSIVAWGYNEHGQCNVPAPNSDFVAVAGGGGPYTVMAQSFVGRRGFYAAGVS